MKLGMTNYMILKNDKTINLPEIPKSFLFVSHRNVFSTICVTAAVCHPHVVSVIGELHGCIISNKIHALMLYDILFIHNTYRQYLRKDMLAPASTQSADVPRMPWWMNTG